MPEHKTKEQNSSLNLSIHIAMGGFSFFTHRDNNQGVSTIHKKRFSKAVKVEKLHEEIFTELKKHNLIGQSFNKVRCSLENNLATLVPKALFEEQALHDYVKKDIDIQSNDFITHDIFPNIDWVTVYVPFVNVNNMLLDTFGSFTYFHAVSLWLNALANHPTADGNLVWSIYKENTHIHLALLQDSKLQFYNCFEADSPKDVAYYTLLVANKTNISPSEVPLFIAGDIVEEDLTYKALFEFVRSINFLTPQNPVATLEPRLNAHQDFCLLNLS